MAVMMMMSSGEAVQRWAASGRVVIRRSRRSRNRTSVTAHAPIAASRRGERGGGGRRGRAIVVEGITSSCSGTAQVNVVREHVPAEVAVAAELLAAIGAVVRLDVGVGEEVGLQIGPLVEGPAAGGTLVWRVVHVEDAVDGEGARLAEALAAFSALEGLLL